MNQSLKLIHAFSHLHFMADYFAVCSFNRRLLSFPALLDCQSRLVSFAYSQITVLYSIGIANLDHPAA